MPRPEPASPPAAAAIRPSRFARPGDDPATSAPGLADALATRPRSDVSAGVGLAGLAGLAAWVLVCRNWAGIADALALPGPRAPMSGANAALVAMLFSAGPMAAWAVLVDKVHRRASTGIDWRLARPLAQTLDTSTTKLVGLWATWGLIGAFYCLARWYWRGQFVFAMEVLGAVLVPLVLLSVPYVVWLDRKLVAPRDAAWHFGALVTRRRDWDGREVVRHVRIWAIKGFFTAFMLSILPIGFAKVVETDFGTLVHDPVALATMLFEVLFMIDVQIGTVGYIATFRPLDAHIRSGNPLLAGWLAALMCYPPISYGVMGPIIGYEVNTRDWAWWLAGHGPLLWAWAALLVVLTAVYAWATVVFGLRFSNLTYRGVITHGPYRLTRHPAYLAKNLFWWVSVLPFLTVGGSWADGVRNTACLALVSAIYYWRARTEEAHLLGEDPRYHAYWHWAARHAPLTRLVGMLVPRRAPVGVANRV